MMSALEYASWGVAVGSISNSNVMLRVWAEGRGWRVRAVNVVLTTHPLLHAHMGSIGLAEAVTGSTGHK